MRDSKCAVENCGNSVKQPGVICKDCLEKYLNDRYAISKCSECDKIMDISEPDYIAKLIMEASNSRVLMSICQDCFRKVNDRPINIDDIDPKDLEEPDDEEDDDELLY